MSPAPRRSDPGNPLGPDPASEQAPSPAARAWRLKVVVDEPASGVLVLRPVGAIDAAAAPLVRDVLDAGVAAASRLVVVDLDRTTSLAGSCAPLLLEAHRNAVRTGRVLRLAGGHRTVRDVLERTGLLDTVGHHRTAEDALAADPS